MAHKKEKNVLFSSSSVDVINSSFDFKNFHTLLKKCILGELSDHGDIDLHSYLQAYEQLYSFFILLGGAFQFIAIDIKNKIKILKEYRQAELAKSKSISKFSTVKSMVHTEKENGSLNNCKYVSGSRTLLRLHRGLDFVRKFLKKLYEVQNDTKLGGVAREVYDETLAEYHTWVVKSTARVAMQFLPAKFELLEKISNNDMQKFNETLHLFPETLDIMNYVYDRIQQVYVENDILNLP